MPGLILKGVSMSPGIAIGRLVILRNSQKEDRRNIMPAEIEAELASVDLASARVMSNLEDTLATIPPEWTECREVLSVQLEIVQDPKIIEGTKARIKHRKICAAWALSETVTELAELFKSLPDPYLSARAQDIISAGKNLEETLTGGKFGTLDKKDAILVSQDLSSADLMALRQSGIQAFLTEEGGGTSHTAILARSFKIPAIGGIPKLFDFAKEGEIAIADGFQGIVLLNPDRDDMEHYRIFGENYAAFEKDAQKETMQPAVSRDGRIISIQTNLENPAQVSDCAETGSDGIGLFRTEYSFLSGGLQDENSLANEYANVIEAVFPKQVVFRTLDTGADDILPIQEALHEPNPALGLRGIRFCLKNRAIFKMQLKSILKAAAKGSAAIMLPMISTVDEVLEVKKILTSLHEELADHPHAWPISLGVMIETPAAVFGCDAIASNCDFISIGTNDLLHYIMAIDRGNRHVAYLHEPFHPAFICALKQVVDTAHKYGLKVSVCGELATDPYGVAILAGLGVDILSASSRFVPFIKHIVRKLNYESCRECVLYALNEWQTDKTRAKLQKMLELSLKGDLPFHNLVSQGQRT